MPAHARETQAIFERVLGERGITIVLGVSVVGLSKQGDGLGLSDGQHPA